jgi:TonB family protein
MSTNLLLISRNEGQTSMTKLFAAPLFLLASVLSFAQDGGHDFNIWKEAVVNKINGLVELPANTPPDAHVGLSIVQQRSGEILSIRMISSSGLRFVDQAVMRAVQQSSPLPKPAKPELFMREFEIIWKKDK